MRIYRLVSTAIGGVFMAGMSTAAFAGCGGSPVCAPSVLSYEGVGNTSCYSRPAPNCDPRVTVHSNYVEQRANIGVYNTAPYGHLNTVEYKNAPNINIMRVHSRTPYVQLSDAPSSFTNGCTPTSTAYCRTSTGTPVNVVFNQPAAPVRTPTVTYGSGYNAAAFAPRQYGSTAFVPGIAHVPTSIVDRSPITHINGIPQPQVHSVTTASSYGHRTTTAHHGNTGGNVIGHQVTGSYTYQPPGGGAYWEKTSGPTMIGGMAATQVLCRREAPRPAPVTVNVVSPVIGVPVPSCAPAPVACAPRCAPKPKPVVCKPKCAPARPVCAPAGCGPTVHASRWTR